MSGLLDAIGHLRLESILSVSAHPSHTDRVRADIERRFSRIAPKEPSEFDLTRAWEALNRARLNGNDVSSLDRRTLRHGPWVMFQDQGNMHPLAADKRFALSYIQRLLKDAISAAVINLAQAFLYVYPRRLPTFSLFAQAIPVMLARCSSARCRRLSACAKNMDLFKPEGPGKVWRHVLQDTAPIADSLQGACLAGSLQRSGFAEVVFEEGLTSLRNLLLSSTECSESVARLFEMALDEPSTSNRLRFSAYRKQLADSLLLPFAQGAQQERARHFIEDFVLRHYGDPRMDRSRWQGISDEAVRVVLSWLVADTLEDFFRLIEHTAQGDPIAKRHWRFRKAFWSAYLRQGVITDAWMVLAGEVDADAKNVLKLNRESYGRFSRRTGVQRNHAALILRIGHLVITDWSHSGKYRVWEETRSSNAQPSMYKSRYAKFDLIRGAHFDGSHHGAETGGWQRTLAGYIRDKTGIHLTHRDLMPR